MKDPLKKIAAVHDLSGYGRCSFSVILPTLSVMGHQVCALPTATLSTHTGGYTGFVFRDLTSDMRGWWEHWRAEGVSFDAFYSGFLGNAEQIGLVEEMISSLEKNTLVFVDPVMGDDGVLYSTYTEEMRDGMKRLASLADVITPNVTEAYFLVDETMPETYSRGDVERLALSINKMTGASTVITGVMLDGDVGCAYIENGSLSPSVYMHSRHEKSYPGTGDIFASVLLGRILKGDGLGRAVECACDFVYGLVGYSSGFDYPTREGVLLEARLSELLKYDSFQEDK